ncbi:sensor histidine kinase [Actinomycetospora soli]|uniref:sensor histidine kinase n=1 Tax=Actinomycetospora soli TaxID=2893887 RepID=UPI001E52484F|nr:hypothetical protein [Actinomycetospora soli]MCD2187871.1 hypothetical protein [Actinomycetospora soli]
MAATIEVREPGPAVLGMRASGRRYAAAIRVLTLVPTVVVAAATAEDPAVVVPVLAVLVAWSAVYVWRVRGALGPPLPLTDAAVLVGLGLSAPWTVASDWLASGRSWIVPFLAFACVAYQYSCRFALGVGLAVVVMGSAFVGAAWALPPGASASTLVSAVWSTVVALLATLLWSLIERGGRRADAALADLERARHERELAVSVREDQRAVAAALHDTAAATLLMVGLGEATDRHRTAARAARDLTILVQAGGLPDRPVDEAGPQDVAALLDTLEVTARSRGLAPVVGKAPDVLLPAPVFEAFLGAATESLTNVAVHAGVTEVRLDATTGDEELVLCVADDGVGFDGHLPAERRGIRHSIIDRVAAVGGTAAVHSRRGVGTAVELRWSP